MNYDQPQGIIEFNNLELKCLIFQVNNNNSLEILSTSTGPSDGIHNDIIVNLTKASNAIRSCLSAAEKKAKVSLKKISVVLEQPDFLCTKFSKQKKINGSKIHKDDIDFLLKEAKKQLILNDDKQSIIHIFNYNYIVDGKNFIEEPIGVYADSLHHEMSFITTLKNNIKNINQVFINCDIEVERLFSKTFTLGVELLNDNELKEGSILINLEYEKISLGIFKNLALVHSITLPIGINHITKDISKVCSLNIEESENIKNYFDFSFGDNKILFDESNFLKDQYFIESNFRKISKNLILKVIKARLDEIFEKIDKQLIISKSNTNIGTSIFLVNENKKLRNLEEYYENFFKMKLKKINFDNQKFEKDFLSCTGAVKIIKDGWETEAIPNKNSDYGKKTSIFNKIFKSW